MNRNQTASTEKLSPPIYREVPIADVFVDHSYQQPLDENWVNYLVDNWNPDAVGVLLVSLHDDGKYASPDGQHRLAAMRRKGIAHSMAEVHHGLTVEQEAALFLSRNNKKVVHRISKFHARVTMREPQAVAIKEILLKSGARIDFQKPSNGAIYGCTTSIERAYEDGILEDVVFLIETCWGSHGKQARSQMVFDGVSLFLRTYGYNSKFSMERAIDKFANPENSGKKMKLLALVRQAQNDATAMGTSQAYQMSRRLREIYNKGARTSMLPEIIAS